MENIEQMFQELKSLIQQGQKDVLTLKETAAYTGLSPSHIYKMCSYKKIPFWKSSGGGKYSYFSRKELNDWMLHRRIKTDDELETEAVNHIVNGKPKRKGVAV